MLAQDGEVELNEELFAHVRHGRRVLSRTAIRGDAAALDGPSIRFVFGRGELLGRSRKRPYCDVRMLALLRLYRPFWFGRLDGL
jgi:hypothetical protein